MSIEHIVLGLIGLNPCSGYDMKMEFEQGGVGMLSTLSFGSIYPYLKRLEQEGLITPLQADDEGRRKKVYDLTPQGWQELSKWLGQQPAYPIPMRDDLLLKMLFWGAAGQDRETLINHLQTRRDESNELLSYIHNWRSNGKSFVDEYTEMVLSYIYSRLEAEQNWVDKTIEQLQEEPRPPVQDPHWLSVLQKARRNQTQEQAQEQP